MGKSRRRRRPRPLGRRARPPGRRGRRRRRRWRGSGTRRRRRPHRERRRRPRRTGRARSRRDRGRPSHGLQRRGRRPSSRARRPCPAPRPRKPEPGPPARVAQGPGVGRAAPLGAPRPGALVPPGWGCPPRRPGAARARAPRAARGPAQRRPAGRRPRGCAGRCAGRRCWRRPPRNPPGRGPPPLGRAARPGRAPTRHHPARAWHNSVDAREAVGSGAGKTRTRPRAFSRGCGWTTWRHALKNLRTETGGAAEVWCAAQWCSHSPVSNCVLPTQASPGRGVTCFLLRFGLRSSRGRGRTNARRACLAARSTRPQGGN